MEKPNLKHEHIFTIIRIDDYGELKLPVADQITVIKALNTEVDAKREVERLNALNKDKGAFYFYRITRFQT